jgi:hypothetical protein
MFRYSAFGLSIDSEMEMPGLTRCTAAPQVTIRLGRISLDERGRRAARDEEYAFLNGVGRFRVRDGCEILVEPAPEGEPADLMSMLQGRIMGYLMKQRGWLPLHAGAVLLDGAAVLFMGTSGMGKSTTAVALHAAGHRALADEVCAVRAANGICELRVAGAPLRLTTDTMAAYRTLLPAVAVEGDKHAIGLAPGIDAASHPVSRIYVLDYGRRLASEPLPPMEAVQALSVNSFINARGLDAGASAAHLQRCVSVARSVPVHRLIRQRSLELLGEVARLVEREGNDK